jgi:hypothetical protein
MRICVWNVRGLSVSGALESLVIEVAKHNLVVMKRGTVYFTM